MSSTTPSCDGGEKQAPRDDIGGSSINQRSISDGRSVSATASSIHNLAGPSSSSTISVESFQPESQLTDDHHPEDLFSFNDGGSHSSSQPFASSVSNAIGYDSSHEYAAISSTLPPVFENLFGQSPPDDVAGAFSIDDVVRSGYAPWDDIDVLSVGLNVPKVLMQVSETDGGVDEADGTSSKLPDSSSSKFRKAKSREPSVSNSTNMSSGQVSAVLEHSSPPYKQPLLQFDDGSPDYQQCSSSSDLTIAKLDKNTTSHSPSEASTSRYSRRKDERETLINQNESPSKILQFIEPDPIDPNNFFDVTSDTNNESIVSQKPTASSSSDLFSNADLLNSSQGDSDSWPRNVKSSFIEKRGCKLHSEATSSSQTSVPCHQDSENLLPSTTCGNPDPFKKSNIAESPTGVLPVSSSSSLSNVSPSSSTAAATLSAEVKEQSTLALPNLPLPELSPLDHDSRGIDEGMSSEIPSSSGSKKHVSIKHGKNPTSALGSVSESWTAPKSEQDLSSTVSASRQFDSASEPSSSSFCSDPHLKQIAVQSGQSSSTSNISVESNSGVAGEAQGGCQTACPSSHTPMEVDAIPSMSSTLVGLNPNKKGQIASGNLRASLPTKDGTEPHVTGGQTIGSKNHPGSSMDTDEVASSSFDPGLSKENHNSVQTMGDLKTNAPSFNGREAGMSQNKIDYKVNTTSEAEMVEEHASADATVSFKSGACVVMDPGTSTDTYPAQEQEDPDVGEGTVASIQSTTAGSPSEGSPPQERYEVIDEGYDFSDSDIDIDDLLDKDLPEEYKKPSKGKKRTVDGEEKLAETGQQDVGDEEEPAPGMEPGVISFSKKTVLKKKGREPLEGLPEHWIAATHRSGMAVYIHRKSRVCTWSRPYFLGPGSVRKHRVPLASIPCLHYMRAKEEEAGGGGNAKKLCVPSSSSSGETEGTSATENRAAKCPETVQPSEGQDKADGKESTLDASGKDVAAAEDGKKGADAGKHDDPYKNKVHLRPDETLEPEELNLYARKVFEFEDLVLRRFQTWSDKRKFWKSRKAKEVVDRPQLPAVPVFDVTLPSMTGDNGVRKKECALNMKDKTPIAILHEYCQKVLRTHPKYVVEESNNAHHPFEAVVFIEGTKYGRGQAQSKKVARLNAARQTLEILLPDVMASQKNDQDDGGIEFFNQISIDDPRVVDLCTKTGQMTPFSVLQDYQQRMHGQNNSKLDFQVSVNKYQKLEYTMKLGPHEAKGPCKSSKIGKQLGAQKILKQLYPKITTWGGIIKLYGKGVDEINKAKREEQKKILALSNKQKNKPNEKILQKLKTEMMKLYGPQRHLDKISTPASVAPSSSHSSQLPAEERSSEVQNQVDT